MPASGLPKMRAFFKPGSTPVKAAALLTVLLLASPVPADARAGGGFSFGSRGARTFSAPAVTPTAPRYAQPFQRTETPRVGQPAASRSFGLGGGLLAGLLGAGLLGSMFGGGFFGGIATLIGFMLKLALLGGVVIVVLRLIRGRAAGPVLAGGATGYARTGPAGPLPGAAIPRPQGPAPTIGPADYAAFEAALVAVQDAYSREDRSALARLATPEMVRHLAADLDANRNRSLRNDVSQPRLLQGDLSEAWSEGQASFATLAMRFAAIDVMVDRASGRIASGDPVRPVEATELWTFRRERGEALWRLSAIQQAG